MSVGHHELTRQLAYQMEITVDELLLKMDGRIAVLLDVSSDSIEQVVHHIFKKPLSDTGQINKI